MRYLYVFLGREETCGRDANGLIAVIQAWGDGGRQQGVAIVGREKVVYKRDTWIDRINRTIWGHRHYPSNLRVGASLRNDPAQFHVCWGISSPIPDKVLVQFILNLGQGTSYPTGTTSFRWRSSFLPMVPSAFLFCLLGKFKPKSVSWTYWSLTLFLFFLRPLQYVCLKMSLLQSVALRYNPEASPSDRWKMLSNCIAPDDHQKQLPPSLN